MSPLSPIACIALLAIAGCAASGQDGPGREAGDLAGSRWQLVELSGQPPASEAWIEFGTDGHAGGNSGCNHFGGTYVAGGGTLSFGMLASTMMGCPAPAMQTETRFHAALGATATAAMQDGDLLLLDGDGEVLARLSRHPAG